MVKPKQPKSFFQYDPTIHGVTQSLLGMFLECREKALLYTLGVDTPPYSQALTDGDIVHDVTEHITRDVMAKKYFWTDYEKIDKRIQFHLDRIENDWHKSNPRAVPKQINIFERAMTNAEVVLPHYFRYWGPTFSKTKWIMAEETFKVPYTSQSGIKTFLRGKIDGAYRDEDRLLYLFDTKNKARIEENKIADILPQDIQMNMYSKALKSIIGSMPDFIVYNIIRRSGIRDQDLQKFRTKLEADVEKRPSHYFVQMELKTDSEAFAEWSDEFDDMMEDFLQWGLGFARQYRNGNACQTKYGTCQYLDICNKGPKHYFVIRDKMFAEL